MKHYFILCLMALFFAACDYEFTPWHEVETGIASDITAESAILHGKVNQNLTSFNDAEYGIMLADAMVNLNVTNAEIFVADSLVDKEFQIEAKGLLPNTNYYYCAFLFFNGTQQEFGEIEQFVTPQASEIEQETSSPFSVSDTKQVVFSLGNLQYHPLNNVWRFAESQSDYIGKDNSNISASYDGWVDLFGWGTGNTPTLSSAADNAYPTFTDWGVNSIADDASNTWRTLTSDEWKYISSGRTNADSLCAVACVDGVNGLILLPDDWACPEGLTILPGCSKQYSVEAFALYQTFTAEQWSLLQQNGAVFLPAAGKRVAEVVNSLQFDGNYHSATEYDSDRMRGFHFASMVIGLSQTPRSYGQSVRLVKDL